MKSPDWQRLEHIRDYCSEIQQTIERYGAAFDIFNRDSDYQKSVAFSILQIGELCNGLSEQFRKETADCMPWSAIRGMRNMAAHNYGHMSREIIWETAMTDIPYLKRFCEKQLTDED